MSALATLPAPASAAPTDATSAGWGGAAFAAYLIGRTALWACVAWTQPNPPLDTVEWLVWGRHWQAGYHKHPPLAAWLAELASHLLPDPFLGIYLLGFACIAIALWCVWRLASDLLPPRAALAAALCLDGLTYLTRDAAEFNNQVVLIAFWSVAVFCFWRGSTHDRWTGWIGAGVALGLALWCKYTAGFLAVSLAAFWLWHDWRRWSRVAVVAAVAFVIFLPHLIWLFDHDLVTLRYAANRVSTEVGESNPRLSGLAFVWSQAIRLVPVLGLLLLLLRRPRAPSEPASSIVAPSRARTFLLFAVLGPVVLHLAASLALGMRLRDIWGVPLWTFVGVLALCYVPTDLSDRVWRRFLLAWGVVALLLISTSLVGNHFGTGLRSKPLRVHYPGKQLANVVGQRWREEFGTPVPIVAGDWWLAANVCVHSSHAPTLFGSREPATAGVPLEKIRGDPARFYLPEAHASSSICDAELRRRGGVLLWDASVFGDDIPDRLGGRFPEARVRPAIEIPFAGGGKQTLRVGWAVLAPPSE